MQDATSHVMFGWLRATMSHQQIYAAPKVALRGARCRAKPDVMVSSVKVATVGECLGPRQPRAVHSGSQWLNTNNYGYQQWLIHVDTMI